MTDKFPVPHWDKIQSLTKTTGVMKSVVTMANMLHFDSDKKATYYIWTVQVKFGYTLWKHTEHGIKE